MTVLGKKHLAWPFLQQVQEINMISKRSGQIGTTNNKRAFLWLQIYQHDNTLMIVQNLTLFSKYKCIIRPMHVKFTNIWNTNWQSNKVLINRCRYLCPHIQEINVTSLLVYVSTNAIFTPAFPQWPNDQLQELASGLIWSFL